jgi:hypothetical protein
LSFSFFNFNFNFFCWTNFCCILLSPTYHLLFLCSPFVPFMSFFPFFLCWSNSIHIAIVLYPKEKIKKRNVICIRKKIYVLCLLFVHYLPKKISIHSKMKAFHIYLYLQGKFIYTKNLLSVNLKICLVDNVTISAKTWACTSVYGSPYTILHNV